MKYHELRKTILALDTSQLDYEEAHLEELQNLARLFAEKAELFYRQVRTKEAKELLEKSAKQQQK